MKKQTIIFISAIAFMVIVFDVIAACKWGWSGTISANLLMASQKRPIIPFALGVLCGHLFWVNRDLSGGKPQ